MKFEPAIRRTAFARLALSGPSGSGKTWSALLLAAGLGGRIALIDTEKGSAKLYAGMPGIPKFDVLELDAPYTPERFAEAFAAAAAAGYEVVICDSTSPEWNGPGGCLEINDRLANTKHKGNTWAAWSDTTPRHRKFIEAMLTHPGHVIATMRSKTDTVQEGKKIIKLGMKAEQRDGIEYEFTVVLDLSHDGHFAAASKDRTHLWMGHDPAPITAKDGLRLKAWLETGAAPEPAPPPPPPPPEPESALMTDDQVADIIALATVEQEARILSAYKVGALAKIPARFHNKIMERLTAPPPVNGLDSHGGAVQ
jgi:hypothetical protein